MVLLSSMRPLRGTSTHPKLSQHGPVTQRTSHGLLSTAACHIDLGRGQRTMMNDLQLHARTRYAS